jgi:hypothetical protein
MTVIIALCALQESQHSVTGTLVIHTIPTLKLYSIYITQSRPGRLPKPQFQAGLYVRQSSPKTYTYSFCLVLGSSPLDIKTCPLHFVALGFSSIISLLSKFLLMTYSARTYDRLPIFTSNMDLSPDSTSILAITYPSYISSQSAPRLPLYFCPRQCEQLEST